MVSTGGSDNVMPSNTPETESDAVSNLSECARLKNRIPPPPSEPPNFPVSKSSERPRRSKEAWAKLDSQLYDFVCNVSLTKWDREMHEGIRKMLEIVAHRYVCNSAQVHVFGSAASNLGERGSDIDASIVVASTVLSEKFGTVFSEGGPPIAYANAVKSIGRGVGKSDERWADQGLHVSSVIATAKIPICVLDTDAGYTIDISINNELPVYNTQLLKAYGELDPRARALILSVKRWAKILDIADAKTGNLSSYSWTIMTVYYLQVIGRREKE